MGYALIDGPSNVLTDTAGNVLAGRQVLVRDAKGGNTVTDLRDADTGAVLPGYFTSDASGRVRGQVPDTLATYWLDPGDGNQWPVATVDAITKVGQSIASASQASADASEALDAVDTLAPVGGDGARHIVDPALPATIARRGELVVNAANYGARRDDAAVQAALDAVADAGGGTVVLPAGTEWSFIGAVRPKGNTRIVAYGAYIRPDPAGGGGPLLLNWEDGNASAYTGHNGHGDITVLGGVWNTRAQEIVESHNCFTFGRAVGITVRDVTIRNVGTHHGLELNGIKTARVVNCRFEGWVDNTGGIYPHKEAIQIDCRGGDWTDIVPCEDVLVDGCYFGPSDVLGSHGRAVGSHTADDVTGSPHRSIRVVNCRMESMSYQGVYALSWGNSRIAGNVLTDTAGIAIGAEAAAGVPADGLVIEGNLIDGTTSGSGIQVTSGDSGATRYRDLHVSGNVVASPRGTDGGIYVTYVHDAHITANTVRDSDGAGLRAEQGDNPMVDSNTVVNAGSAGIFIQGGTGGACDGNIIDQATGHGIQVGGASGREHSKATVASNHVTGADTGLRLSGGATDCLLTGNKATACAVGASTAVDATSNVVNGNMLRGNTTATDWQAAITGTNFT